MRMRCLVVGMTLIVACSQPEAVEQDMPYFDLAAWIEAARADWAGGKRVTKYVQLGNEVDTLTLQAYDADAEWDFWAQWDINRAAWKGAFTADTSRVGEALLLHYQSAAEHIPVSDLKVWQRAGRVDSLFMRTRLETSLTNMEGAYHYRAGQSMHIRRESQRRLGKDQTLDIRLEWQDSDPVSR
jgi:hypothetical protein